MKECYHCGSILADDEEVYHLDLTNLDIVVCEECSYLYLEEAYDRDYGESLES